VIAPAYPGFEVEVEAPNADPTPIERVTVPAIIERLEAIVGELESPPIIIGHSAGGVFTQILLDHGFGAAGVAIDSAPTEGAKRVPLSQVRASFPVLKNPGQPPQGGRPHLRAVALHVHQRLPRGRGAAAVRALPRPRVRRDLLGQRAREPPPWQGRHMGELRQRGARAAAVHLRQRRPPDAAVDPAHYNDSVITEVEEFEGPHLLPAAPGWEEVADYALHWALKHAALPSPR
jgi:hypothetical protein